MQGRVLGFDVVARTGAIRGRDEARYAFNADDWKGAGIPAANDEVDFEPVDGRATEIFVTRAALNLNFDKLGQSVDNAKVRGLALPLLGSWHPALALLTIVACFWMFMTAAAPGGVSVPGMSPNLFGTPGAVKQGLTGASSVGDMTSQLTQYGQTTPAPAPSSSALIPLLELLPWALYLIPLGSAFVIVQEARRVSATPLAFLTGALSVALPLIVYFGLSLAIQSLLKDMNEMATAFGSSGYHVNLGAGAWTIMIAGVLQIAVSLRFIRGAPSDVFGRPAARPYPETER